MQSLHHSRARILFDAACAFGVAASCAWAWQQTYALAMLSAAAIAGLYGLVRASDVLRGGAKVAESVDRVEAYAAPEPVAEPVPELATPFGIEAIEPSAKRARKPAKPKARGKRTSEPEGVQFAAEPQPEAMAIADEPELEVVAVADEPEVVELPPELRVVERAPDEPQYIPATPLFEAEPFVRQQRAAFGRKAR